VLGNPQFLNNGKVNRADIRHGLQNGIVWSTLAGQLNIQELHDTVSTRIDSESPN